MFNVFRFPRDFHLRLTPSTSLFTKSFTSTHNNGTLDPVDISFIYDGTVVGEYSCHNRIFFQTVFNLWRSLICDGLWFLSCEFWVLYPQSLVHFPPYSIFIWFENELHLIEFILKHILWRLNNDQFYFTNTQPSFALYTKI